MSVCIGMNVQISQDIYFPTLNVWQTIFPLFASIVKINLQEFAWRIMQEWKLNSITQDTADIHEKMHRIENTFFINFIQTLYYDYSGSKFTTA